MTHINKRHDDAIHSEASRPAGRPSQFVREDSQIDFATGNVFFGRWGGGGEGVTQDLFSNFSNNRFFQTEKLPEKILSARKNIIGNITLRKTSRLNLD